MAYPYETDWLPGSEHNRVSGNPPYHHLLPEIHSIPSLSSSDTRMSGVCPAWEERIPNNTISITAAGRRSLECTPWSKAWEERGQRNTASAHTHWGQPKIPQQYTASQNPRVPFFSKTEEFTSLQQYGSLHPRIETFHVATPKPSIIQPQPKYSFPPQPFPLEGLRKSLFPGMTLNDDAHGSSHSTEKDSLEVLRKSVSPGKSSAADIAPHDEKSPLEGLNTLVPPTAADMTLYDIRGSYHNTQKGTFSVERTTSIR